jgi:S-adenosylmethionine:tRNA ribosyltransferase-isomerase
VELAFDLAGADLDAAIASVGQMPLPPYIAGRRAAEEADRRDYQTIYAAHDGAVAAPTAVCTSRPADDELEARGVSPFRDAALAPARSSPSRRRMPRTGCTPSGRGQRPALAALNEVRARGGRIIASAPLRWLLESAAGTSATSRSRRRRHLHHAWIRFAVDVLIRTSTCRGRRCSCLSAFGELEVMQAASACHRQHPTTRSAMPLLFAPDSS